jgi:hypothetical protein
MSVKITEEDREQFHRLGDVNRDGIIDKRDLEIIQRAYGSKLGSPNWNPEADLNHNGAVDLFDLVICSGKQGLTIQSWKAAITGLPTTIVLPAPAPPTVEVPTPPPEVIPPQVIPVPTPPIIAPPPIAVPPAPTIPVEWLIAGVVGVVLLIGGIAYLIYIGGSTSG